MVGNIPIRPHPNPIGQLSVFHAPPRGSWWACAPWTWVVPAQQGATYWLFFPSLTHFPIPLPAFPAITTQENHVHQNHCLRVCLWGSQPKEENPVTERLLTQPSPWRALFIHHLFYPYCKSYQSQHPPGAHLHSDSQGCHWPPWDPVS